ncbi:ankyrin repeat-containing domain protein [Camillea tinctor]|nr:ankyrin repeat-containing domain protein [Camillea tinctor]
MKLFYDRPFQLVLAHGITDESCLREETRKLWSTRLPNAIITDFAFFDEDIDWDNRGFIERAQALLHAIGSDRRHWGASKKESWGYLPCAFLCHELGGALVKQALVLASQDMRFSYIIDDTAILILYDTPDIVTNKTDYEYGLFRLLSTLQPGPYSYFKLLQKLPSELVELSHDFSNIHRHFETMEIKGRGNENTILSKAHYEGSEFPITKDSASGSSINVTGLWDFPLDQTDIIFARISQVVERAWRPITKKLHCFLRFLSKVSPGNYQLRLSMSFPGALKCIEHHPSYRQWQSMEEKAPNILYLYGKCKLGNTAILSQLILSLQQIPDSVVISFSFSKKDSRMQSIIAFYVSLIRQIILSRPEMFHMISTIASWIEEYNISSYEVLSTILHSLIKRFPPIPVFCIIHKVEECAFPPLYTIANFINTRLPLFRGAIKFAILGRTPWETELQNAPETYRTIDLSAEASCTESVAQLVKLRVERLSQLRPEWRGCKDNVFKEICDGSSTLFQASLATILMASTKLPSSESAVVQLVDKLPSTLDETYRMTLEYCQRECSIPLLSLMRWIRYCVRPLTLQELSVVTALETAKPASMDSLKANLPMRITHDLRKINGTLIRISGLLVYPVHSSLYRTLDKQWKQTGEDSESIVTSLCLDYLDLVLEHMSSATKDASWHDGIISTLFEGSVFGLLRYVVVNWPEQFKKVRGDTSRLRKRMFEIFGVERKAKAWFQLYQECTISRAACHPAIVSPLKIASRFGLFDIAIDAIHQLELVEDPSYNKTLSEALELAASYGHECIVDLLLDKGAWSNDALCLAAAQGCEGIVETLVTAKPDMVNKCGHCGKPPFFLAALNGNQRIAADLFWNKGDCHKTIENNLTALHITAKTGQIRFLDSLIRAGVDVNAVDRLGLNALMMAAGGGFDSAIELLLEHGASVQEQSKAGETALHLAVEHGHISTCEILLNHGIRLLVTTKEGLSPIHLAAKEGHLVILQRLLTAWKMPSDRGSKGREVGESITREDMIGEYLLEESKDVLSPLQLAASYGHIDVVRELLRYPRQSSQQVRAPSLLLASASGFLDIVEALLEDTTTNDTNLPHLITQQPCPKILGQLLHGFSNTLDVNPSWTTLHIAAAIGRLLTVRILLREGASLNSVTDKGSSALHIAAVSGHSHVIREILHRIGHDKIDGLRIINFEDLEGYTAFTRAIQAGHLEAAKALFMAESSIPVRSKLQGSKNALNVAVEYNHEDLVRFLLDNGWDLNAGDASRTTALHIAASVGTVSMINFLVRLGADVNSVRGDGGTPLHLAALGAIQTLVEKGVNIDARDQQGLTPLWRRAFQGSLESVKELIKHRPNPELERTRDGWTPLHAAYNNPEITKILVEKGANPNAVDKRGYTPLFFAARDRKGEETIKALLGSGADLHWKLEGGETALHIAAEYGRLPVVQFLVENGIDANAAMHDGTTPLHIAAVYNRPKIVEYLLNQHGNPNANSKRFGTPLMIASWRGCILTTEMLIKAGAEVNATNKTLPYSTALQAAAQSGADNVIEKLLKSGADVNITGGVYGSALLAAIERSNLNIVSSLLKAGANINYGNGPKGTALEYALGRRQQDIVNLLLKPEYHVEIDTRSQGRYGTALLAAIESGNLKFIKILLKLKADINLCRTDGSETPVQAAIRNGRLAVLEILVENKASLAQKNNQGQGALSQAIQWKSVCIIPYLLGQPEVKINEKDVNLRTPLMMAVRQGNIDIVEKLLSCKADINLKDYRGATALMEALSYDYHPISQLLVNDGDIDLLVKDVRGRDALYWATRMRNQPIFDHILGKLQNAVKVPLHVYQNAMCAAIAAGSVTNALSLLQMSRYCDQHVDQDGWTADYTNHMYHHSEFWNLPDFRFQDPLTPPTLKAPSGWHPVDMAFGLRRLDDKTITMNCEATYSQSEYGIVRADHPMVPRCDNTYYFEVTVTKGSVREVGVGFCEESTPLDVKLGQKEGSWGYHGNNDRTSKNCWRAGAFYGPKIDEGDTIGCGVNFKEKVAFYVKNGEIIGRASSNKIRGKLFPAVSVRLKNTPGLQLSIKLPGDDDDDGSSDFVFKGTVTDPRILQDYEVAYKQDTIADDTGSSESLSDDSSAISTPTELVKPEYWDKGAVTDPCYVSERDSLEGDHII